MNASVPNVCTAAWYAVVPAAAVFVGARVASLFPLRSANARTAVALLAFAAVITATFGRRPSRARIAATSGVLRAASASALFFMAFAAIPQSHAALPTTTTLLIWLGAALEEVVFREALPQRLSAVFARGCSPTANAAMAAQALAQCVFAVCHFVPGVANGLPVTCAEGVRLFSVGALYAAVATVGGLSFAITAHAGANLELLRSHDLGFQRVGACEALAWAGSAAVLVRLGRRRASTN
jgi:hypothetical protein